MSFILKPIFGVVLNGFVLYLLTFLVKTIVYTGGIKFFIIGGIVLGLINFFVKPLLKLISLPFVIITGGLFLMLINVFLLWFLQYFLAVLKFQDVTLAFPNLESYVIGAVVFGAVNWAVHLVTS